MEELSMVLGDWRGKTVKNAPRIALATWLTIC